MGFDEPLPSPEAVLERIERANEAAMQLAVDTGTDMVLIREALCGHGFQSEHPTAPCYRGPNANRWFDLTCTHPKRRGHDQLAEMFTAVITE